MRNIALISPSKDVYSESFIRSHRKNFDGNVKFYYDGHLPISLEGKGRLDAPLGDRLKYAFRGLLRQSQAYDYLQQKALEHSFKEEKIDIVFAEYGLTGARVYQTCERLNIPLIVNFHGYDVSVRSIVQEYEPLYKNMFQYASGIVAVSRCMVQDLVKIGCPKEKIVYTPCAPADIFLDVQPQYNEDSFLFVGRFVEKKAPYYAILAFAKVLKHFPQAKLYMAGIGELFDVCKNLVRGLNIDNSVILLGKCTHEELLGYYEKVKGYVQHSITAPNGDTEGTPVAILEASAAALPVISTKHAGISDVIIHGETGFLVEEHDIDGMAESMIRVLNEKELSAKMGQSGRENVKTNYRMSIHAMKLNNLIEEVLLGYSK